MIASMIHRFLFCVTFLCSAGSFAPVLADFGPKFREPPNLSITFDWHLLTGEEVVLAFFDGGVQRSSQKFTSIPDFGGDPPPAVVGADWLGTTRGAAREKIRISAPLREKFRVVVRISARKQVFVSNVVDTHPLFDSYTLNLHSDGTAQLSRDSSRDGQVAWLLALYRKGFLRALAVTLVAESLVIGVILRIRRQSVALKLVLLLIAGNLTTLLGVWILTLGAFALTASVWCGFVALAATEICALLSEAGLYAAAKCWRWRDAILVSSLANGTSFLAGFWL